MARLTTKSVYGIGKQAKQSPANKGEYMKLIDLLNIVHEDTEIFIFDKDPNMSGIYYINKKVIDNKFLQQEVLKIRVTKDKYALKILLK